MQPFDDHPAAAPPRLPSPFDPGPPHPLARRAADALVAELEAGRLPGLAELDEPGRGKMFGVLVVRDAAGRLGWLKAFSGMLGGTWFVDGFSPPLFDPGERAAVWPAGEAELRELDRRIAELESGPRAEALARREDTLRVAQAGALDTLTADLAERKRARAAARVAGGDPAVLADESKRDSTALRRFRAAQKQEEEALAQERAALQAEIDALIQRRADRSRELLVLLFEGYHVISARGVRRSLYELFAPEAPPGGAGDCAAPKLLNEARVRGLTPIALAEFWWGAPPVTGGRHARRFYPACRGKCGPVLPHLLDGLDVEPAPIFGGGRVSADEPRIIFEDAWIVVVDKPVGLLSVPGRSGALRDSAQVRLRQRYPGLSLVHRLDLDTSGILLAAKDDDTHAALQRLFARREMDKRYVAWLEGEVAGEAGTIDLPLRVDLDDRPRQIVDPVHGKPAVSDWRVLARREGRTRVELTPHTGRTHQLRVHAAVGLKAPIVGDRLYGHAGERLLLHAERLSFVHPATGARVEIVRPAPF